MKVRRSLLIIVATVVGIGGFMMAYGNAFLRSAINGERQVEATLAESKQPEHELYQLIRMHSKKAASARARARENR